MLQSYKDKKLCSFISDLSVISIVQLIPVIGQLNLMEKTQCLQQLYCYVIWMEIRVNDIVHTVKISNHSTQAEHFEEYF